VFDSVVFSLVYCCRLSYLRVYNNKGSQGRPQVGTLFSVQVYYFDPLPQMQDSFILFELFYLISHIHGVEFGNPD